MATGYDEEGADELICVSPPDDEEGIVIASAFAGLEPRQNTGPLHAIGVSDVAIEAWVHTREGSPVPGDPTEPSIGLYAADFAVPTMTIATGGGGPGWPLYGWGCYRSAGGWDTVTAGELIPGWHHYVANFDRNGNMTGYRDSVLMGTQAMPDAGAPTNQGNMYFYPLTALLGNAHINILVGPVALHVGTLLTTAQMADSIHRGGVQILAETQQAFFWKDIDGATGWDTENISAYINWRTLDDNNLLAAPEGTAVIARDSSGNGNDWTMPTAAAYTTLAPAQVAFLSDRFWR